MNSDVVMVNERFFFQEYYAKKDKPFSFSNPLECKGCPRCMERNIVMEPEGSKDSKLVIIGRDYGGLEEKYGRPFYPDTSHGRFLAKILEVFGFERNNVYISNALYCRGTNSRAPVLDEVFNCMWWKLNELDWRRRLIFPLGKDAVLIFLGERSFWQSLHKIFLFPGLLSIVIPLPHPSYLIRRGYSALQAELNELFIVRKNLDLVLRKK